MSQDGAPGAVVPGRSVGNGRYELRSVLGRGGMASVLLAYDTVLDRSVAVKTLHTELGREQSFRERFRREAQTVAKLNHTNIVSVFDSGEDVIDGAAVPYIVMEYVEGRPLREVLDEAVARHGAMPTEPALKITGDVLAALEASHEVGLVHRDIKPGNVMVTSRGVVKVMDFGIARALQSGITSTTQTGMVVGTPQYLSPEQALGRGVDARSDLYSVGCLLFELLTGRLPFDGDSPLSIAYQHVQEDPPVPSSINQAVPPAVDALIARALKKNPADRFPTAEAMRDESIRVREGERVGNTPLIITEGPRARGASGGGEGVSSAIFPKISGEPGVPPGNVPPPYQPQGYTRSAHAPQTPPPAAALGRPGPSIHPAPPGPGTPGGYHLAPQPHPPQQQNNGCGTAMIVVGIVVAVLVLIITVTVVIAIDSSDPPKDPDPYVTRAASYSSGSTATSTVKSGNPHATGDLSSCQDPYPMSTGKNLVPSFMYKDVNWVRDCADAGGWELAEKSENESLWGKDMVVDQDPGAVSQLEPGGTITIWVSSGHE